MTENQRKERKRDGRGKNLKLSRWIEAVIFHPADAPHPLPPVLGDRVGREAIVAAACVRV